MHIRNLNIPFAVCLACCAWPASAAAGASKSNPVVPPLVWVAAVAPRDARYVLEALAHAHIAGVIRPSYADGVFVTRGLEKKAIAVLKHDGSVHHYQINFGDVNWHPKIKKASPAAR